jgi:Flp pilus assembly protein protease CpaA
VASTWLGAPGIQQSAAGFLVCAIVFVLGIVFRVGGGDLKLFVALGAMLGLSQLVYVSFVALSVAVVYSLINLLVLGQLNAFARIVSLRLLELFYFHRVEKFDRETKPLSKKLVPMGVPFAVGLILSQIVDLQSVFGGGL